MRQQTFGRKTAALLAAWLFALACVSGCGSQPAQTHSSVASSSAAAKEQERAQKEQERAEKERQQAIKENTLGETPQALIDRYNAALPGDLQELKITSTSDDGVREVWHEYTGLTEKGDVCKFTLTVPGGFEQADSFAYKGPWNGDFNQQMSMGIVSYLIPAVDPSLSNEEIGRIITRVFKGDTYVKNDVTYTAAIGGDGQIIFVAFRNSPYRQKAAKQKKDESSKQESDDGRVYISF